jgi:putative pyrroloquinoline-quinone binding quinoprotein
MAVLVLSAVTAAPVSAPTAAPVKPVAAAASSGSWTEYHRDDAHTGYDSTQPTATGASAGWTSPTLNGQLYDEPLVYNGLVYVGTLQNTVYALHQSDGTVAWSTTLNPPETTGWSCGNVSPQGILGTGLIDAAANRVYYAAFEHATDSYWLYAFDLGTGSIVMRTQIAPTGFDWTIQQERGALALSTDRTHVYVPFGGRYGDCGPYHGWVVGVPTSGAAVDEVYKTVSTGEGVWAAGGVVVDDTTGNVFFATGNAIPCSGAQESDSVIGTTSTLASPTKFQPADWAADWCSTDTDLGSVAPVLISPSLMFTTGKYGQGFLLNPANLGGTNGQLYPPGSPYTGVDVCVGNHSDASFGSVSYANGRVYLTCENSGIVSLTVNASPASFSSCDATCSAAGTWHTSGVGTVGPPIIAGGVVWAVGIGTPGAGLYGFDAATGAQIYHSAGFDADHFVTPTEAGGQIFVPAGTAVRSFNMTVNACTSVTASAAPPSPSSVGTGVMVTASATGCPSPMYQFWTQAPGGGWTIQQPYSATATFNWNTAGLAQGTWHISVWARDATSPASYDAYVPGFAYTLTGTVCTGVSASAAPASPQAAGIVVTITATASGCPNPRYEFWTQAPGGSWAIAQPYSSAATFTWNTTPPAGSWHYSVWARDASSSASYDTYFPGTAYTLTTTQCTGVTASAAPASPQAAGTTVTITASASGCSNPHYEFWTMAPGGSWTIAQPYSSSTIFSWSTTPPAGAYKYSVWVRDATSGASYDAYFPGTAYTLTTTPCTGVTASASPASPQAAGTAITISASASGCANPRYEFWILAPGGSWTIMQPYSSTATFNWNTTGLADGGYEYSVWARDTSSGASYDTYFPGTSYTLT